MDCFEWKCEKKLKIANDLHHHHQGSVEQNFESFKCLMCEIVLCCFLATLKLQKIRRSKTETWFQDRLDIRRYTIEHHKSTACK